MPPGEAAPGAHVLNTRVYRGWAPRCVPQESGRTRVSVRLLASARHSPRALGACHRSSCAPAPHGHAAPAPALLPGGGGERGCPLATPRECDSTEGTRAELSSALETAGASKAAERTVRAADSPTLERWEPPPVRALEAPHTGTAGGALAAWSAARTAGGEPSAEGWTSRPREALSRRSC